MENNTTISYTPVPRNFWPGVITDEHWTLGDVAPKQLMPDNPDWGPYLPPGETQLKNGIDPSSCPAGATLNAIEAIGTFKYGTAANPKPGIKPFQNNLSERYLCIVMGMDGHGGDPHFAAEAMYNGAGAIPEVNLPFDRTITTLKQFFSPRPISYALFKIGYHWQQTYAFNYWWIFHPGENISISEKILRIKQGLTISPVCVSGFAWSLHNDGLYYHDGPDIHWFMRIKANPDLALDTYEPYIKQLDPNYNYGYAMGYSLERRQPLMGEAPIPDEPQPCKLQYALFLFNWFINNLKRS